jgi:NADH dehydrogenase/NADH:ubiquinone oxidoreductase subunit G
LFEHGERLATARIGKDPEGVDAMIQPALSEAATLLSSFVEGGSGEKLAAFASPFSTLEEYYIFGQFATSVVRAGFIGGALPEDADEDHLLLRKDKAPNSMGLKLIGQSVTGDAKWGVGPFRDAIAAGTCKGVVILDATPPGLVSPLEEEGELLSRLDLLIVLAAADRPAFKKAHVTLPLTCFVEQMGTYVNFQRRIQLQRKGIEPPREVRPAWAYLEEMSSRMGATLSAGSSDEIFRIMSKTIPELMGVQYKNLGLGGVELRI